MKYILIVILLISCQTNYSVETEKVQENLTYFKDEKTNLCFASINSSSYGGYSVTSITCVPCDSLKRVKLKQK